MQMRTDRVQEDASATEAVADARERTAGMSAQELRQLVSHFRDKVAEDPAGAGALLSVDTTAAMTLLVAQIELGILGEEAVLLAAQEDARATPPSSDAVAQPYGGYSEYQLELLRQVVFLTPEMMQGLSPFQQQQLMTLQHMTRASGVLDKMARR
mmetsp:Transcript_7481/g.19435  ORF Transcript_7481/g.19435 Transcript_7481/m.19435 type:complete len:155 (+) Transcript_7481:27-491(+)